MSTFRKYDHLERLGHSDCQEILMGKVHIFPKLDGTNASAWWDPDQGIQGGSRRRHLSLEQDNAGFLRWLHDDQCGRAEAVRAFCEAHPELVLYGEWMVPHTLKTYRQEAWHRFWVFDVYDREAEEYLSWSWYSSAMADFNIDLIEPLCTIDVPSEDQVRRQVETNTYLIQDGAGLGEGIVIKRYDWKNKHGRQPWAKVVRTAFKEDNARLFGAPEKDGEFVLELAIAEQFCTPELVGKTYAKVLLDVANQVNEDTIDPNWQQHIAVDHRGKVIPQLIERVFYDLVTEEIWAILKKHKNATINFKALRGFVTMLTKKYTPELFS